MAKSHTSSVKHDPIENPDTRLKSPIVRYESMSESMKANIRAECPYMRDDDVEALAYTLLNWHIAVRNGVLNRLRAYARKKGDWEKAVSREYFTNEMMPGKKVMEVAK